MAMTSEKPGLDQPSYDQPSGDRQRARLWRLFLSGPVIYSIYFSIVFTLAEFGCFAGIQEVTLWGQNPIRLGILLATVIAALLIASVGFSTFRRWRRLREGPVDPEEDDPLFMLLVGVWLSGIFTLVTVLSAVPMLLGSTCDFI